jgi:hypothetical protein
LSGNAYSRDGGATWSTISGISATSRIAGFNGRQYVFVDGNASYVAQSVRGQLTQINVGDNSGNVLKWNGSYWLLGGLSNAGQHLLKSSDGFNWIPVATNIFSNGYPCNGLAWNGKYWVASGITATGTILATSSNGSTWTLRSSSLGGGPVEWNGAYWVSGEDSASTNISVSSDGNAWTSINIGAYGKITGIAWSGKSWLATTTSRLLYSSDGSTWTAASLTGNSYLSVGWSGSTYVAVTSTGSALYSYNGSDWTSGSGANGAYNVTWTHPEEGSVRIELPVIVGGSGTYNTMLYSQDGAIFRGLGKSTFNTSCRAVAWNGDIWVAGGSGGNTLAYSYDGITWTGLGSSVFSTGCYGVATNGITWVAVGAGTNTIATSLDGKTWFGLGTQTFGTSGASVAWNGSQWLAVGSDIIAHSSDPFAQSWTIIGGNAVFSNIYCVKWLLGKWFVGADASGSYTMASSPDTTTWTYTNTALDTSCKSIAWNGREVLAVGSAVSISTDGVSWSTAVGALSSGANGVEWNGREWIIAAPTVYTAISTSVAGTITGFAGPSALLTNGYCVGANSRVGAFVPNNRLYINAGDRLTVYGPEAYDGSITQDTSILLNMNLPV